MISNTWNGKLKPQCLCWAEIIVHTLFGCNVIHYIEEFHMFDVNFFESQIKKKNVINVSHLSLNIQTVLSMDLLALTISYKL